MTLIPDQKNIKIHFAAVENMPDFVSVRAAKVNYVLFTVYPLIAAQFGYKPFKRLMHLKDTEVPQFLEKHSRHVIMDSGLFTLMFGSQAGAKDASFIERWQEAIIEFVQESGYSSTMVEIDCQKVLGVNEAWTLREQLRDRLPNRQINVYHIDDGYKGLDRLIEFSDYLAVSVPELKSNGRTKTNIIRLTNYIKNRKPEIDIHLLGCTDLYLLTQLSFCTSSDSTSWNGSVRYGTLLTLSGEVHIDEFKNSEILDEYLLKFHYKLEEMGFTLPYINYNRSATLVFAAEQIKLVYARYAGDQS